MAPDLDVIIGGVGRLLGDEFLGLAHHRGFTHSLAFAPIGALFVAWVLRRGGPWGWTFACALVAWLTHGPLDCCTTYGTELLWPFDRTRIAWNNVAIIDPIFTTLLGVGLVAGHRRGRRTLAMAGMALSLLYLGWGVRQRDAARDAARSEIAQRGWPKPRRLMAAATPLNNVLWRVVAQLDDGRWTVGLARVGWFGGDVKLRLSELLADERPADAAQRASDDRGLAIFEHFTDGWTRYKIRPQGGWRVLDMRYAGGLGAGGADGDSLWGVDLPERGPATRYRNAVKPDLGRFRRAIQGDLR